MSDTEHTDDITIDHELIKTELDIGLQATGFTKAKDVVVPEIFNRRVKSGIRQIDEGLLDDGVLPGSTFTLTARAGCGKTTLMLQILDGMAKNGYKVGYCSGEESIYQLGHTCDRINVTEVELENKTCIEEIAELTVHYDIIIIDSFQALTTKNKMNIRQKEIFAVQHIVKNAKHNECIVGLIMHLTKTGELKGSTVVPHTVDACWNIDRIQGADDDGSRVIYITKNRFGPCSEYETLLTRKGYDFEAKIITSGSDNDTGIQKAKSKSSRKQTQITALMDAAQKENGLTIQEAIPHVENNVQRTQFLLRELVVQGKLIKRGRGDYAIWIPVDET